MGYIVIETAVPFSALAPADAIHAAPIFDMDAFRTGFSASPFIISTMLKATSLPITPDGIPVRGGVGEIGVPFVLFAGFEMA